MKKVEFAVKMFLLFIEVIFVYKLREKVGFVVVIEFWSTIQWPLVFISGTASKSSILVSVLSWGAFQIQDKMAAFFSINQLV